MTSLSPKVVLVTGVSRFLGGHLAARLAADPAVDRVLGVDTVAPPRDLLRRMGRAEFVRADIRNPLIGKVISKAQVDTVVHASLSANPGGSRHSATKEMNVIGTMQLLAACQRSPAVRRLVVKSTGAVYGSSARDPAMFTETMEPKELSSSGYAKDAVEIEGYVRGFSRRRKDVAVTILRFSDFIGPQIDTVLTRYFASPVVVPTVLGYDGRVQLLHEEDALAVLERAAREDLPGVFNVGGDGVLLLSQAIRRAGRIPVPIPGPAMNTVGPLFSRARLVGFSPDQIRYLNFGRVLCTRKLRTEFGFRPQWTTGQAFDDYVRGRGLRPTISPERVAGLERTLLAAASRLR